MSQAARKRQDAGTPYARALGGDSSFTIDQRAMAIWCESVVARSAAYSPRLIWDGAVAAGLTPRQLYQAWDAQDWHTMDLLTFADPTVKSELRQLTALAARLPR